MFMKKRNLYEKKKKNKTNNYLFFQEKQHYRPSKKKKKAARPTANSHFFTLNIPLRAQQVVSLVLSHLSTFLLVLISPSPCMCASLTEEISSFLPKGKADIYRALTRGTFLFPRLSTHTHLQPRLFGN